MVLAALSILPVPGLGSFSLNRLFADHPPKLDYFFSRKGR